MPASKTKSPVVSLDQFKEYLIRDLLFIEGLSHGLPDQVAGNALRNKVEGIRRNLKDLLLEYGPPQM